MRSRLADPLVSYELRWATDAPMTGILESQLDDAFERVDDDGGAAWRRENRLLPDDRFQVTDDGDVRVYRQVDWWVRSVLLALILLAPLLLTSLWSVGLYFVLVLLLDWNQYTDRPIPAATEIVSGRSNGLVGILAILTVLGAVLYAMDAIDHWIVFVLCAIALGIIVTKIYLEDGLPFVSPDLAKRPMQIPFSFLANTLGVTALFFPVVLLSVFVDRLGAVLGSYAEGETNRATASILADITGGRTGPPSGVTPDVVRQAIIEVFAPMLWIAFAVSGILLITWLLGAKPAVESYYRYRLRPFSSPVQRTVTFLVFVSFTVSLYTIVGVAAGILLYGVTGVYYLPAWTLSPLLESLPGELSTSAEGFLAGLYRTLDFVFADAPLLYPRSWSLLYLTALLWPFVFAAVGTLGEIVGAPYRAVRALQQSTPLPAEIQLIVDDGIQVRRIDCGGYPDLRPLSVLFGTRKYVLISDVVVEECQRDELEGLLLHEQYHLQERSLGFGALVLSSILGGANLLPAFYDYRKSERLADASAAAVVGEETLRHAIIRLYDVKARAGSNPIGVRHPSAIGNDRVFEAVPEPDSELADIVEYLRRTLRAYLLAPYRLYFGGILLDTAHMKKRERLAALRDD